MPNDDWIQRAREQQDDYNNIFREWRYFDPSHRDYIRSTIGLILFGIQENVQNPPPMVNYYQVYSPEKQDIINTIHSHIQKKCNDIFLSCTYLIGKLENDTVFSFPVLRYTSSTLSNRVYFSESTGRYYKSWDDFLSSNQLPACKFCAPVGGVYGASNTSYQVYNSPAANTGVIDVVNKGAAVGTLACAVAGYFALAPVTVSLTAVGIGGWCIQQSFSTLYDRFTHGQSIALNNRESLFAYGNIVATGVTGATVAAAGNLRLLRSVLGNTGTRVAIGILGVGTVIFDSAFLIVNAMEFMEKLRAGTVTSRDVFDLSLQIFLTCGSIVQVRNMHKLMSQSQSAGTINKKLTKTQKRNLQKRRARARARGQEIPVVCSDSRPTVTVTENDTFSSLQNFALHVGGFGVNVMMKMYPRSEVVLNYFYEIKELIVKTFVENSIKPSEFLQQLFYHTRNLSSIITQDIAKARQILSGFISDTTINNDERVAQFLNNEVDRVNEAIEENIGVTTLEEGNEDPSELRIQNFNENTGVSTILQFIKETYIKYRTEDCVDALITFFNELLTITTIRFSENCIALFNETLERNERIVDRERALIIASILGRKTTNNDFLPTACLTTKVLDDCKAYIEEYIDTATTYWKEPYTQLAEEVFEKYFHLMSTLYEKVTKGDEIGVCQMASILLDLSSSCKDQLIREYSKISSKSRTLYTENADLLGEDIAKEIMKSIQMPISESEFLHSAMTSLKTDEIVAKVKEKNCGQPIAPPDTLVGLNENICTKKIIAELAAKLFNTIKELKPDFSESEHLIKVFQFLTGKLIEDLKLDIECYDRLRTSEIDSSSRNVLWNTKVETIDVYKSEKFHLFKMRVQLFQRSRRMTEMALEFLGESQNQNTATFEHPKLFKTIIDDDGFTTYHVICYKKGSNSYFMKQTEHLFNIQIDHVDCKVHRDEKSVVVKSRNNVITFSFLNEANRAIVIRVDLDRTDEDGN